jgi:hypothetical protein
MLVAPAAGPLAAVAAGVAVDHHQLVELVAIPQQGQDSFYRRRTGRDDELDITSGRRRCAFSSAEENRQNTVRVCARAPATVSRPSPASETVSGSDAPEFTLYCQLLIGSRSTTNTSVRALVDDH